MSKMKNTRRKLKLPIVFRNQRESDTRLRQVVLNVLSHLEKPMTHLTTLLSVYANVFGGDFLRYVLGAGGTYLLINVLLARRLAAQKVRLSDPPKGQIRREILVSLRTVLIFTAAGTSIVLGARAGVITIYQQVATFGWAYFAFSIVALIVLHDAWFYWTHRALHYPPLFRRFHRLHHKSHQPTPFTSYSFDVGEAVVNAVYLPLVLILLPAHPLALFVFVTHMMLRNAVGHCGIEIFPADQKGRPVFGWLTSVTHHDLHHAHAGYNLGLYFSWWDRLMKTEHPKYLTEFARVAPRIRPVGLKAALLFVAIVGGLAASRGDAFELSGRYASPGLGIIVEFEDCGRDSATRCGRLLWSWEGQTPHAKIGDLILTGLVFNGTAWEGMLRDPESGRTYRGTIRQPSQHRLILKGCAGIICASQTWHSTNYLRSVLSEHGG
ncbi:sterol desaturase family protein [Ruegeria arenilitoris]|uniref:sterol desaturase family protein n=1 Tax=Ruegeria arenilitoris TaxID=1173585 RepID=UPI00147FFB35|nr:sterol desaturase family protein [Ruegeria arenilitoris]